MLLLFVIHRVRAFVNQKNYWHAVSCIERITWTYDQSRVELGGEEEEEAQKKGGRNGYTSSKGADGCSKTRSPCASTGTPLPPCVLSILYFILIFLIP